ncbi:MAG: OmpA family protein [Deltaproteobacteria bacterium]|nr:OmpA family protein [Deltaproteobacteria bacterium]
MAIFHRSIAKSEDDESVFISMTDIMISLLFVVIILMAFFAMQTRSAEPTIAISIHDFEIKKRDKIINQLNLTIEDRDLIISKRDARIKSLLLRISALKNDKDLLTVQKESLRSLVKQLRLLVEQLRKEQREVLDKFLAGIAKRKLEIMEHIAEKIRETAKIQVSVDHRQGVVRFDNRDLFSSGQWRVSDRSRQIMEIIADAIFGALPCFTTGPSSHFAESCNPEFAIIDAIQIEGHTDDQPTAESLRSEYIGDNLELSVRRATMTFRTMVAHEPGLATFKNAENPAQPVLSVSGYGETRPIVDNTSSEGREHNRRIDLRFIMMTPQSADEVENFKGRLLRGAFNWGWVQ